MSTTKPSVSLIRCLHSERNAQALIYLRIGAQFYRLSKEAHRPLQYVQMASQQACIDDAHTISRYSPAYALYDSINNAPMNQHQLEAMVEQLQAMGHLCHGGNEAAS